MAKYIVKRLIYALFVLLGVITVVFFLTRLTGNPVALLLPIDASTEQVEALTRAYGFDKPVYEQFFIYLGKLAQGDFGTSVRYNEPTLNLIMERMPATLKLAGSALGFSMLLSIPIGIIAALNPKSFIDRAIMSLAMVGQALPVFWVGILLILIFSVNLGWLPTNGYGDGQFKYMIMPVVTLGLHFVSLVARLLRSSLIEVMGTDYIRTAKAKGLLPNMVLIGHALKNSLLPVVTVVGLQVGGLLGGSVVTESIFAWPGVGQLIVNSISNRDFPVVQTAVIFLASTFVLVNLAVDLIYMLIDPRISYETEDR